jgi:anti-anti-sigma factor
MSTNWSETITITELSDEPALSDELTALTQRVRDSETRPPHIVLNFGAVTYLNSSNIAQLLRLRAELGRRDRRLKLCCVTEEVWSVVLITGLDKVFQFAPDTLTALAGLQLEDSDAG